MGRAVRWARHALRTLHADVLRTLSRATHAKKTQRTKSEQRGIGENGNHKKAVNRRGTGENLTNSTHIKRHRTESEQRGIPIIFAPSLTRAHGLNTCYLQMLSAHALYMRVWPAWKSRAMCACLYSTRACMRVGGEILRGPAPNPANHHREHDRENSEMEL